MSLLTQSQTQKNRSQVEDSRNEPQDIFSISPSNSTSLSLSLSQSQSQFKHATDIFAETLLDKLKELEALGERLERKLAAAERSVKARDTRIAKLEEELKNIKEENEE